MAELMSQGLAYGSDVPAFTLKNVSPIGVAEWCLYDELSSKIGIVLCFWCNHCPYVRHIESELLAFARTYQAQGLGVVAISSNDAIAYPEDSPEAMRERAVSKAYPFAYLVDDTQAVAKAYQVQCTPEFVVVDAKGQCLYHGRFDGSYPGSDVPVSGEDLREVCDRLLMGNTGEVAIKPSRGCSIKWYKTHP